MTVRLIQLRYQGTCVACSRTLDARSKAWYDSTAKTATCQDCHGHREPEEPATPPKATRNRERPVGEQQATTPTPPVWVEDLAGEAGLSARREYDRRRQKREAAIDAKWGKLGGVVKVFSTDPQSTRAWAVGAAGEERFAKVLGAKLPAGSFALHDRKVPGTKGNIDHIVVSTSGVWIVDAKAYKGRLEKRETGSFFSRETRLYIDGRDRTSLVEGMGWQVAAVEKALSGTQVNVRPVLCFTTADWPLLAGGFEIAGVVCSHPRALAKAIATPGPLPADWVQQIAQHLATTFPPNS